MSTTDANTIWTTAQEGPLTIRPGSLKLNEPVGMFECQLPDLTNVAGPMTTLLAYAWKDSYVPPGPGPLVCLLTDAHIDYIRDRLYEGQTVPNLWTDHAQLISAQQNQLKGGSPALPVPGRTTRSKFVDPGYQYISYESITLDEQGCGFADDGMAVFTQALWWRLYASRPHLDAAKAGALKWARHQIWFDAKTADGTARGKFWASTGVTHYCDGVALMWGEFTNSEKAEISDYLWLVFMDSRTTCTTIGAVYDSDGNIIRPNTQGGGSLLDERAGPNHQAIYTGARMRIGLIIRQVNAANGQAIFDDAVRYFEHRTACWIRENGPGEPVSPSNGAPYPPPPDENGWDTLDLLSQQWWLSLDPNPTHGDNFRGGLKVDGLIADTSRDVTHAMFTLEAWCQAVLVAANNRVEIRWPRGRTAGELHGRWLNEAGDQCWNVHGGNWSALDASTWLPSMWADHGIGTRGGSSTGGSVTPSAPTFDVNGAGMVGGGWYVCHWVYREQMGMAMPELDRWVKRIRGVPENDGGSSGPRGPEGPAAGTATVNGPSTTPNGSPYSWGPFLFTAKAGAPVPVPDVPGG